MTSNSARCGNSNSLLRKTFTYEITDTHTSRNVFYAPLKLRCPTLLNALSCDLMHIEKGLGFHYKQYTMGHAIYSLFSFKYHIR